MARAGRGGAARHRVRSRIRRLGAAVTRHEARGRCRGGGAPQAPLPDRPHLSRRMPVGYCPECGAAYEPAVVACPRCRAVLTAEPPVVEGPPEVIHRVPDAAAGALLEGMLQHNGILAVLRSTALPGYGLV